LFLHTVLDHRFLLLPFARLIFFSFLFRTNGAEQTSICSFVLLVARRHTADIKNLRVVFGNNKVRRGAAGRMKSERRFYTRSSIYANEKQELTSDAANDPFRFSRSRRTWLWATSISHDMGAVRFAIRGRRGQRANMRSFL